ncbi:hypothetical protein [Dysgonomonas termitidis]|uniref:Uncharacterized protein n=1 Tax=Dysgonomonas termitidis TaxID=1516126 RepID=A0ABV9KTM6_9BACT
MDRKRIGFVQDRKKEGEDSKKSHRESPETKAVDKVKIALSQFIRENFDTSGDTEDKDFKTSAELAYMLRESIRPSVSLVSTVMEELGFRLTFIEGVPHWSIYLKDTDSYPD